MTPFDGGPAPRIHADAARTFTFTSGKGLTQTEWQDQRSMAWPDLMKLLTKHDRGAKEGPCIVPAVFRSTRRLKAEADQIDLVVLDADCGHTLDEIDAAVRAKGWAAIVHSTHSHLTTRTTVKKSHWDKFFAACPIDAERAFLIEKGYLPHVAKDARVVAVVGDEVTFEHAPCSKFRIVLPLTRPWKAADYPNQNAANAAWKERIEALAAALGLSLDQSCTDTSRLFYLPRHPGDGRAPVAAVLEGAECDIWNLPASSQDLQTGGLFAPKRAREDDAGEFIDPETGECIDLREWAKTHGQQFEIVAALKARTPGVFVGHVTGGGQHHIRCANEDAHTRVAVDRATFIVNSSEASNKGFAYHCRHQHCTGPDRLFFVRRMLERGWLKIEDLTSFKSQETQADDKPRAKANKVVEGVWTEPLDFLADAETTGAPELRAEHLPEAIAPFVFDTAARMGVDPAAVALCAIVALSSVMDDEWSIQPKVVDNTWTENPRLWGAIVGDPSMLKTPILKATTAPIDKMEVEAREHHDNAMRRYKAETKTWKDAGSDPTTEPKMPRLDRYLVEGTTTEALTEALRDDYKATQRAPSGKVLIRQDEMSEWVASFDRYRPGGGGGADRGAYLRLYNGGRYTIDRVQRGTFSVPNWSACVLGGIQPGPIRKIAKEAADDGLLQRFCYCVPSIQTRGEDQQPNGEAIERYQALFPALAAMRPPGGTFGSRPVVLHAEAQKERVAVLDLVEALQAMPDASDRLKSALGKWPGLWARMTLVFHLIGLADARVRGKADHSVVGNVARGAATTATRYLVDILLPHLLRAEAVMFSTVQTGHARWIAGFILSKGGDRIADRDLCQAYRPLRAPEHRRERIEIMSSLEAMGWVRAEIQADARPPVAWSVNPKVFSMFAEQAKRERANRHATKERIKTSLAGHMSKGGR